MSVFFFPSAVTTRLISTSWLWIQSLGLCSSPTPTPAESTAFARWREAACSRTTQRWWLGRESSVCPLMNAAVMAAKPLRQHSWAPKVSNWQKATRFSLALPTLQYCCNIKVFGKKKYCDIWFCVKVLELCVFLKRFQNIKIAPENCNIIFKGATFKNYS